jgi:flagellar biosynthesis GTPase FlhF
MTVEDSEAADDYEFLWQMSNQVPVIDSAIEPAPDAPSKFRFGLRLGALTCAMVFILGGLLAIVDRAFGHDVNVVVIGVMVASIIGAVACLSLDIRDFYNFCVEAGLTWPSFQSWRLPRLTLPSLRVELSALMPDLTFLWLGAGIAAAVGGCLYVSNVDQVIISAIGVINEGERQREEQRDEQRRETQRRQQQTEQELARLSESLEQHKDLVARQEKLREQLATVNAEIAAIDADIMQSRARRAKLDMQAKLAARELNFQASEYSVQSVQESTREHELERKKIPLKLKADEIERSIKEIRQQIRATP